MSAPSIELKSAVVSIVRQVEAGQYTAAVEELSCLSESTYALAYVSAAVSRRLYSQTWRRFMSELADAHAENAEKT